MKHVKKLLAFLLTLVFLLALLPTGALAISSSVGNFNGAPITGDGAADMVAMAFAQLGRKGSSFSGYNASWCAQFVSDCAVLVGQSDAIPMDSYCPTFWQKIINAGGCEVSISQAKPGDIVFYDWEPNGVPNHVEIVYEANGSTIKSIGGNKGSAGTIYTRTVKTYEKVTKKFVWKIIRPNYTSTYANLGDDFYGVILNKLCWKPISQTAGTDKITLQTETGTARQKWHFARQSDGSYVITSCYDGKALEMTGGNTTGGTQMTARTPNGADYQQWFLFPEGDGYAFTSKHDMGFPWTMNLSGGNSADGTPIVINHEMVPSDNIWSIYKDNDVQLQATTLSYSLNAPTVTFTWPNRYGAKEYNLRIFKDSLWNGPEYSVWNATSGVQVDLPAGTYYCYVDTCDYYQYLMSNTQTVTVPQKQMTVTFNANGGTASSSSKTVTYAGTYGTLPTATREGYALDGWYTSASGGTEVTSSTKVTAKANHTLYAHWTATCAGGHDFQATAVHAPTCTDEGYTEYTCSRCAVKKTDDFTPVIAHDYQNGACTVCGEALLTVTFDCGDGGLYSVYATRDTTGAFDEHMPAEVHPRNPDSTLIDCSGLGEVNFDVSCESWYEVVSVTASPTDAYGALYETSNPDDSATCYRLTNVRGDVTIHIETQSTATPLEITQQPECVQVSNGATATVSVLAQGDGLRYAWYYKDPGMTDFASAGVTTANYSVTMTEARNGRQLFCRVTDIHDDSLDSNPVILTNGAAIRDFGECGENLTWVLDGIGNMTIFGTSEMYDFFGDTPWHDYNGDIQHVVFDTTGPYIGECAFAGCATLTSVTLPPTLREIGDGAFSGCESLKSITIPDSVTSIGNWAFSGCSSLTEISIPAAVTSIGENAYNVFQECESLTAITVAVGNPNYSSVDGVLFNKNQTKLLCCPNGRSAPYTIPSTVTSIEDGAFASCWELEGVSIPNSVTSIGKAAFEDCWSLTSITIPSSVSTLPDYAFNCCDSLQEVNLPSNLTSIGRYAFSWCHALESITIPARVSSIGFHAFEMFSNSTHLSEIIFLGSAPTFEDDAFFGSDIFKGLTATVYYPADDATWTEAVRQDYGGTITWVAGSGSAAAPEILTQPVDYVGTEGSTASFTVVAQGDGPLTYQWWIRNPGANAFSKSTRKTATYSTTLKAASNGRELYCVVTDCHGNSVTSDTVTMTIAPTLTITRQPVDYVGAEGSTASFTVVAQGDGPLTYQWWIRNPGQTEFTKSTRKTATYSTTLKAASNGRELYCVITDSHGNSATSDTVTMTIAPTLTITRQPVDYVGAQGSTASFTVAAQGDGPLTYQWWIRNPGENAFSKSTRRKATYSTTLKAASSGRELYCVITDSHGNSVQSEVVTMTIG